MFDEDRAMLNAIKEYTYDLKYPQKNCRASYFDQRSYARWAAQECYVWCLSHIDTPIISAVEEFRDRMDDYSTRPHDDRDTSVMFSIAYDVATDILDILLAMR